MEVYIGRSNTLMPISFPYDPVFIAVGLNCLPPITNTNSFDLNIPIALCKINDLILCILFRVLFFMTLLLAHHFVLFLSSISVPKSFHEVLMHPTWK